MEIFNESNKRIENERIIPRRLVVKIGTQTFCDESGIVHENVVSSLAEQILDLREKGIQTAVVCSGAVALGRLRVPDISNKRLAASIGQPLLMQAWNRAFYPVSALQFLFSNEDLKDESAVKNMIVSGLAYGIPIINGSGSEDNDSHAAKIAHSIGADSLVLLTNKNGVLDHQERTVPFVGRVDDVAHLITDEHSTGGIGGMKIKAFEALTFVRATGNQAFIAHGRQPEVLRNIVAGRHQGITRFA